MNKISYPTARCLLLSHPQERDSGDYLHRVVLPGRALAQHVEVAEIQSSNPNFVRLSLDASLLVINMVADPVLREVMELRTDRGLPTVYEISDDFQAFPRNLPGHVFYAQRSTQALIEDLASRADLLQFSSHGLVEKYGCLNKNAFVAMNQLECVPALSDPRVDHVAAPVLGWAGSVGHLEDARELALSLRLWLDARPVAAPPVPALRVMAAESVQMVFREAGLNCHFEMPGSFEDYMEFLGTIDIGLAWLAPSDFANGRSDGKYLEYASHGVVCIASRQGEYARTMRHQETGYLFSDRTGFIEALNSVFDDREKRLKIRSQAHEQLSKHRLHSLAVLDKLVRYRRLPNMSQLGLEETRSVLGKQLIILHDECEDDWFRVTRLHSQGQLEDALSVYLGMLKKRPSFHELWLRSAHIAQALGAQADACQFFETAHSVLKTQLQHRM